MTEVSFSGVNYKLKADHQPASLATRPAALLLYTEPETDTPQARKSQEKLIQTFQASLRRADIACVTHKFNQFEKEPHKYDTTEHLLDGAVTVNWLCNYNRQATNYIIFAYGSAAWVGMQLLMRRPEMDFFVLVAPATEKINFSFLYPCPAPGVTFQGLADKEVVPEESKNLIQNLVKQKDIGLQYVEVPDADHYFNGKMDELSDLITAQLIAKFPLT